MHDYKLKTSQEITLLWVKDHARIPRFEVPSFGTVPNLILTFMG